MGRNRRSWPETPELWNGPHGGSPLTRLPDPAAPPGKGHRAILPRISTLECPEASRSDAAALSPLPTVDFVNKYITVRARTRPNSHEMSRTNAFTDVAFSHRMVCPEKGKSPMWSGVPTRFFAVLGRWLGNPGWSFYDFPVPRIYPGGTGLPQLSPFPLRLP